MMKWYIYIFFCCMFSTPVQAQHNNSIEKIEQQLKMATVDSEQVRYLYRLGDAYVDVDLQKAMIYADSGLKKATHIDWQKGIAILHSLKGNIYGHQGQSRLALKQYYISYNISKRHNNKPTMVSALNDIAVVYHNQGDYVKALPYFTECLKLATELNDDRLAGIASQNIGQIFTSQQDYVKALAYLKQALQHVTRWKNNAAIAGVNDAIGIVYSQKKEIETAEAYFKKALHIYSMASNPSGVATVYGHLGFLYGNVDVDRTKSLQYELKAQQIWDTINPRNTASVFNLGNIGYNYLELVQSDTAGKLSKSQQLEYLQKASMYTEKSIRFSRENNDKEGESHYLLNLAEINERQGNYQAALAYAKESYTIKDSLFSQENKNKIAAIESTRQIETRDKQIQINNLALTNERRTRTGLIAGSCLLLVIGGLLFYQNYTRRKTNTTLVLLNSELDEANKVKTKFFGILSHDLRSPIINLINFLHLQKEMPELFDKERTAYHQKEITASAENLLDTMEAMLLWSKSQMDRFAPQKMRIEVNDLFNYLEKQIITNKNIKIDFYNEQNLYVSTDEDYLKTIMYNLTSNAVKALQHTSKPQIIWKAFQKDGHVMLSIADNGPGVAKEQIDALYNENAVVGTRYGLGLHLIRDLAKAIQCKIQLVSKTGEGASFILEV